MSHPEMLPPQVVPLQPPGARPPTNPQRFRSSSLQPSVSPREEEGPHLHAAHPPQGSPLTPLPCSPTPAAAVGRGHSWPSWEHQNDPEQGLRWGHWPLSARKRAPHHSPPPDTPCIWEATLTGPGNAQEDIPTETSGAMAGFGELGEEGQAGQIGAQRKQRQEGALGRDWLEVGTVQGPGSRSDSGRP